MERERARILLDVSAGGAGPITFVEGTPVPPFSIGRAGGMRIDGPGVLDVHAYVVFDGVRLFAYSASPTSPLLVEGRPVPSQWAEIRPPCRLRFGGVDGAILVGPPTGRGSLRPPTAMPPQASMAPPARSMSPAPVVKAATGSVRAVTGGVKAISGAVNAIPGASLAPPVAQSSGVLPPDAPTGRTGRPPPVTTSAAADNEMTRVGFNPAELASFDALGPGGATAPRPAAGSAAPAPMPSDPATAAGPSGLPGAPAPPKTGRAPVRRSSQETKRLLAVGALGVSMLVAIGVVLKKRNTPPPAPPPPEVAAPAIDWAATTPPRGVIVYPAPRVTTDAVATKGDAGPPTSLERVAVDALYRGDLDAAAKAYEALAAAHPENPAYARAARTLRR